MVGGDQQGNNRACVALDYIHATPLNTQAVRYQCYRISNCAVVMPRTKSSMYGQKGAKPLFAIPPVVYVVLDRWFQNYTSQKCRTIAGACMFKLWRKLEL